jgi:hypothetical protein
MSSASSRCVAAESEDLTAAIASPASAAAARNRPISSCAVEISDSRL